MANWFSRLLLNLRALALALLVHILLFALMGVSLSWNRTIKPASMQPIQAQVVIEPQVSEPLQIKEPVPEPEPEPEIVETPKLKPLIKSYAYTCAGKQLQAQTEEQAKTLQAECEEKLRKKKEAEDLRKKKEAEEKLRKKEEAEEKLRKKKEADEKLRKKKEADEKLRKKKEADEKLRKKKETEAAKRRQNADEQARKANLAREAAARVEGEAVTALGLAVGRIAAAVDSNWIQPQSSTLGLEVVIRVNVSPGGVVMSARVVKSSGNALFDRSAEIAVQKASPLPIPSDPRYYPHIKEFDFRFKPNG